MISLLIDSSLPGAQDLLDLVGECGNSKEVTISVQEVLERLRIRFSNDDEDEEEPTRPDERKCSTIAQFIRSLDLYSQGKVQGFRITSCLTQPSESHTPVEAEEEICRRDAGFLI